MNTICKWFEKIIDVTMHDFVGHCFIITAKEKPRMTKLKLSSEPSANRWATLEGE